jgi:hypothetical protein
MTPVAARGSRFGLVNLLVAGGSAAFLGAFGTLTGLAATSFKSAYNADENSTKEPRRLV